MRNKKTLVFIFLVILSIISSIISYRTYLSFVQARKFTLDFNTRSFDGDQKFVDELIVDLPNLSATVIPIKAIKAFYLINKDNP